MNYKKPTIEVLTEKNKLEAGNDHVIDVLLRITPQEFDNGEPKRPDLNLSLVIDRSGSMQGSKMREAREAAKYCVEHLRPTDRISVVIFDHEVDVLVPSQKVQNIELLKRAINSIQTAGSTALHKAWVHGGIQVSGHLDDDDAINRVLLITDGQANVGETDPGRIIQQAQELAARGVSTTTIGIGEDFNEDLLMPMAEAGKGNTWHVREPQDMVSIFETELQGLIAQVGHSVTLGIGPRDGVTVAEVLNDFETDASGRHILPNLRAGSPLDIVVRLRVPAHEAGATAELAQFDLTYIGQDSKAAETVNAAFVADFALPAIVSELPKDFTVTKAVELLMSARAQREAVAHMDRRDFEGARRRISDSHAALSRLNSISPSADLEAEILELSAQRSSLDDRQDDPMTRKRMHYNRERIRKSTQR